MKKFFTLLCLLMVGIVIFPSTGYSQVKRPEPCATTQVMKTLFDKNPQSKVLFETREKELQALIKNAKAHKTSTTGPVYTIPVVVHIFHTGQTPGTEDPDLSFTVPNPVEAQIQAAVDLANADFNKRANVARYTGGDSTGIQLCLAKKDPSGVSMPDGAVTRWDGRQASTWTGTSDPSGNATRYMTYGVKASGNISGDGVTDDDISSVVKWDPTKYYNIYLVTQIDSSFAGAGVKGFAYLPGSPSFDYAIMDPSSFSYDDVSTFVHEMGHALGLRHTFRGANGMEDYEGNVCPDQESTCDGDGDFICDIPQHKSSYPLFCQTIPPDNTVNTCPQATGSPASLPGTHGEFTHNFMNYGGCTNTFSPDQATRMRAIFGTGQFREVLVSSTNLTDCGCDGSVPTNADVSVNETVTAGPYYNGQNITYTVSASNSGPDNASGVSVFDILPSSDVAFVSSNPSVGTYNSSTRIWVVGNIAPGATHTLTVVGTITNTGSINTCATIFANEADNNQANNTSCVNLSVSPSSNLSIIKTAPTGTYSVGQNVTYTIVADNAGPDPSTSVTVTDILPAGLTYVSSNQSAGSYNSGTGIWNIGTIGVGASETLTLTAQIQPSGSTQNCASISSSNFDGNAANNSACKSITVIAANDLAITKTVTAGPYYANQNVSYTLTANNNGPGNSGSVQVSDLLPSELTFVSSNTSFGTYTSGTGVWDIGNMTNGSTATLIITAKINNDGSINNCATISANANTDPTSGNNSSCVNISANPVCDLAVIKSASGSPYFIGQNITYTINATNNGPSNATSVNVTDTLPSGVTFVSASSVVGSYNSSTGIWNIGNLAATATASMTITCTMNMLGTIDNCASIAGGEPDDVSSNDSDCVSITVSPVTTPTADFTAGSPICNYNGTITYTNTSIGVVDTYSWDFGVGATPATANTEGPHTVAYSITGAITATLTVSNISGNDAATKTTMLNPSPAKPTISASGNTLTSSAASGNQWYMNGSVIGGATNQNYNATQSATYTVLVTDANSCTMVSDPFVHTFVGINSPSSVVGNMSVYPNPFNQDLTVSLTMLQSDLITLEVIDYTGKVVATPISNKTIMAGKQEIKLNAIQYNLKQGMYILKLTGRAGSQLLKVSLIE